jgi:hypothetical protein
MVFGTMDAIEENVLTMILVASGIL